MADDPLLESIKRRMADVRCESCRNDSWQIQDRRYALINISDDAKALDSTKAVPTIVAICDHCGFIRLYSTLVGDKRFSI